MYSQAEIIYCTTRKKLVVVVEALKHFRLVVPTVRRVHRSVSSNVDMERSELDKATFTVPPIQLHADIAHGGCCAILMDVIIILLLMIMIMIK